MERNNEGRMTKRIYRAEVGRVRRRGRSRRKLRDGVEELDGRMSLVSRMPRAFRGAGIIGK